MPARFIDFISSAFIVFLLIGPICSLNADQSVKATYSSNTGQILKVDFNNEKATVTVHMPDESLLELKSAPSASGARYSNGSVTFWEHQGEATLSRNEAEIFKGTEVNETNAGDKASAAKECDIELFRSDAEEYINWLKNNDNLFAESRPVDPFECMIDAGEGIEPIAASCSNVLSRALINGNWAALFYELRALDDNYRKNAVIADGFMSILMKKTPEGKWQGIEWFLGSDIPVVEKGKAEKEGASEEILRSLEWTSELE